MSDTKQKILDWVRSKNPQTMELKKGCLFEENFDLWVINCERCENERIFAYSCTGDKHDFACAENNTDDNRWRYKYNSFSRKYLESSEYVKIIGSDMGLQELLIAVQSLPLPKHLIVHRNGDILLFESGYLDEDKILCKFDLTKNLHQQSEEFYQAILPLINE